MPLPLFLIALAGYAVLATAHRKSRRRRAPDKPASILPYILATGVPVLTGAVMVQVFIVSGAAGTVQFNAGNPAAMRAWSVWVDLFPVFLFLGGLSVAGNVVWIILCLATPRFRSWLPPAVAGGILSALSVFAVASHFPSA